LPSVLTHPAVVLALGPAFARFGVRPRLWLVGAACSVIPDLDSIGYHFGVPYNSMFGHRGFSHSLFFALVVALLLAPLCRRLSPRVSFLAAALFCFCCTASHGLLDALTSGGLGVAFFSPFGQDRYFFPWRPILVSPLSISQFLAGRGVSVLLSELQWVVLPSAILGLVLRYLVPQHGPNNSFNPTAGVGPR
jgi:inner membrane protein